jgi:hypothetical protein
MPKWIQDQALPTKDKCPFTGWGSSFQAKHEVTLPFRLTQFTPNRKIEHPVFLSESGSDSPTSPDMILGCDLIHKLGLGTPKVQLPYPSHHLGTCRSTYGPSWTLDTSPNW